MNPEQVESRLTASGFTSKGGLFRRGDLQAHLGARWLALETNPPADAELIGTPCSAPGLWKTVRTADGTPRHVFDVPLSIFSEQQLWDDDSGDTVCPVSAVVDWASATMPDRTGGKLQDWRCPPREALEESLPTKAFTIELGKVARQAVLHCLPQRLAVSLPLVNRLPADLSPRRLECLNALLADVHARTRIVRLAKEAGERNGISAEVDLTGAPHFAAPRLVRIAVDAVRHVAAQTISTFDVLVDPAVTFAAGETPLVQASACGKD